MTDLQLTTDGREVPLRLVNRQAPRLTPAQRDIVTIMLIEHGTIRCRTAGMIMHEHRGHHRPRYYSSDGWSALRRLEKRGLVHHPKRGVWALMT